MNWEKLTDAEKREHVLQKRLEYVTQQIGNIAVEIETIQRAQTRREKLLASYKVERDVLKDLIGSE